MRITRGLAFCSLVFLFLLAIFNADYRLEHRIFGGGYFLADLFLMLAGACTIYLHPLLDKRMLPLVLLSALLDAIYLISLSKWSWAEWSSTACSFTVAIWLSFETRKLPTLR